MPPIEGSLGNAFGDGGFRQVIAYHGRRFDVAAVGRILRSAAGGDQRNSFQIIDELGVNVLGAAENAQAGPLGRADNPLAHVSPPSKLLLLFGFLMVHGSSRSVLITHYSV